MEDIPFKGLPCYVYPRYGNTFITFEDVSTIFWERKKGGGVVGLHICCWRDNEDTIHGSEIRFLLC